MEITNKNVSLIFKVFILFAAIYITCVGPWGSDAFGYLFGQEIKSIIQSVSGVISIITLIIYFSAKGSFNRSITKLGNAQYTKQALDFINTKGIPHEIVEKAIERGICSKRRDSLKYTWTNNDGVKYIIITNTDGVVSEVAV